MNISVFGVIGITLILIEIYSKTLADYIENSIIELPKKLIQLAKTTFNPKGKAVKLKNKLFLVGLILGIVGFILLNISDNLYTIGFVFIFFGLWIPALWGVAMIWSPVLAFIFKAFNFLTRGKALAGMGLLMAVFDIIS
ncbi:hypothetical protein [Ulvibacterium marinum]|uniref:Uncharacterized protein n=1 Tax=Ulvibacterium marinum TaxID=2419782 RepID=A0A3B0CDM6_9FLAO|nr:hypothetical protein [Ulvibacterium marinum]RKN81036.1 hypothetical protein D7Z94_08785 [Ulvibacterium marinum]